VGIVVVGQGVAWVTGAGSGIGAAVAVRLAREGWHVAASARSRENLDALARNDPRIFGFPLDVTDGLAVARAVSEIETRLGPIDLAMLNAGTYEPVSAGDFTAEKVAANFDVNVMGTAKCLEHLMPRMIERQRGHIAVVSSLTGYVGLPTASGYGATKAALINMCQALEPELAVCGVRMTVINPGFVDTPLTRRNDFAMPFLIGVEDAAKRIVRGLGSRRFEIAFPLRMSLAIRLLAALPHPVRLAITRRMVR
jgi:NAD(P)-dependent dehydrogenase (short-subunit alcohol dehydrogenase family)